MHQNARGYVQDSFQSLQEAKNCLEEALETVEKILIALVLNNHFMLLNSYSTLRVYRSHFRKIKNFPSIDGSFFKWHTS